MTTTNMRCWPSALVLFSCFVGFCLPEARATEALPAPIEFAWSPSGKHAAFTAEEHRQNKTVCPTELQELDLDAMTLRRLLHARPGSGPQDDLSCFYELKYSADGGFIYFVTPGWATSGAIHALDRRTGKVNFIIDGAPYLVIGTGPLMGMLLVMRRKYPDDVNQGPYEEIDLVDPKTGTSSQLPENLHQVVNEATDLGSLQMLFKAQAGWVTW
jgi:hypothetical protein